MTPDNGASRESDDSNGDKAGSQSVPVVRFEDLAHGHAEIHIRFQGQDYRLRVTKNGKLILNK